MEVTERQRSGRRRQTLLHQYGQYKKRGTVAVASQRSLFTTREQQNPLTNEDVQKLTQDKAHRTETQELKALGLQFNHPLVQAWNPDAMARSLAKSRLSREIQESQPMSSRVSAHKPQQSNPSERLKKLQNVSRDYRNLLLTSIQDQLNSPTQTSRLGSLSARLSALESTATSHSKVYPLPSGSISPPASVTGSVSGSPSHKKLGCVSRISLLARKKRMTTTALHLPGGLAKYQGKNMSPHMSSTALLKQLMRENTIEEIRKFCQENPLTQTNYHRANTLDKELSCLTNVLTHNDPQEIRNSDIIQFFHLRHRSFRNSLLATTKTASCVHLQYTGYF